MDRNVATKSAELHGPGRSANDSADQPLVHGALRLPLRVSTHGLRPHSSRPAPAPRRKTITAIIAAFWLLPLATAGTGFSDEPRDEPSGRNADEEKTRKLTKRLLKGADAEDDDLMTQVANLMEEARRRLHRNFDPGPRTRALQNEVIDRLDDAIDVALLHRSKSAVPNAAAGDRRRIPDERSPDSSDERRAEPDSANGDPSSQSESAANEVGMENSGAFKESRRGWGHLPPRDREEIVQGVGETALEVYRELIDQYYRALAESPEP